MAITEALAFARAQIGKPYNATSDAVRFGLNAYDCSGYVCRSLWEGGMPRDALPTNSADMTRYLQRNPALRLTRTQAAHTPGALLLKGGPNGYGPLGHVGFSVGDGIHTLEARGSTGVRELRGLMDLTWDDYMLAPQIGYAPPPAPTPPPTNTGETTMLMLRGDATPHVWLVNGNTKLHLTGDQPGQPGTYGPWLMFCVAHVPGATDPTTHKEWVVPQRMVDTIPTATP